MKTSKNIKHNEHMWENKRRRSKERSSDNNKFIKYKKIKNEKKIF